VKQAQESHKEIVDKEEEGSRELIKQTLDYATHLETMI